MTSNRHILPVGTPIVDVRPSSRKAEAVLAERVAQRVETAHAAGFAEGQEAALAGLAPLLDGASERLDAFREEAAESICRDAVELAVEIARQLVQCQVQAEDYDLERMVRGALDAADVGRGECTVHVAPEDHDRLADVAFRTGTRIVADPEMRPGDVHVETPRGLLVRELGPTLDAIREQLLEDLA